MLYKTLYFKKLINRRQGTKLNNMSKKVIRLYWNKTCPSIRAMSSVSSERFSFFYLNWHYLHNADHSNPIPYIPSQSHSDLQPKQLLLISITLMSWHILSHCNRPYEDTRSPAQPSGKQSARPNFIIKWGQEHWIDYMVIIIWMSDFHCHMWFCLKVFPQSRKHKVV